MANLVEVETDLVNLVYLFDTFKLKKNQFRKQCFKQKKFDAEQPICKTDVKRQKDTI